MRASMTPQTPRILQGGAPTVAMNSLEEFTIRTNGTQAERIEALYRTGSADVVHAAGGEMFEARLVRPEGAVHEAPLVAAPAQPAAEEDDVPGGAADVQTRDDPDDLHVARNRGR